LPFGKGKKWLNGNVVADAVFGGWQLGGIITLQSGFPSSVYCGPGNWQNNDTTCYADATGIKPELSRGQQDPNRWFNLDAFANRVVRGEQSFEGRHRVPLWQRRAQRVRWAGDHRRGRFGIEELEAARSC